MIETATVPRLRPVAAEPAVTLLRAAAAVLVVYGYLVGLWVDRQDAYLGLVDVLRRWVNRPFGLGEDFGPFGVMLLLAACGYVSGRGAWGRLARLYVPVVLVTATAGALLTAGARVWTEPATSTVNVPRLLGNVSLVSHLLPDAAVLVPLAWVVLLAMCGALASAAAARLRPGWVLPAGQLAVVAALVVLGSWRHELRELAGHASFYPMVVAGQLVYLARSRAVPVWLAGLLGTLCWALVAVAEPLLPELTGWWYPVAAAYAGLLLTVAVLTQGRVAAAFAASPVVRWASDRVWWLVLLPGAVGWPVVAVVDLPVGVGILLAVLGTVLAAELGYWLVRLAWSAGGRRWEQV
ncbi:MAG: hypothetical protein GEU98_23810 [Pseudonocardiaceae bacterium]|nr:hypothetical protein [Pseudonocardiaceae bacterium]